MCVWVCEELCVGGGYLSVCLDGSSRCFRQASSSTCMMGTKRSTTVHDHNYPADQRIHRHTLSTAVEGVTLTETLLPLGHNTVTEVPVAILF